MATLSFDSDPDPKSNVVFIDTNLHTHLAVLVSHLDTVSDLKKRILLEHPLCFPKIGQIQIHAVKVKRRGYFYHLSDLMFVRNAFNGVNKSWFLSVDASALEEHGQNEQLLSSGSPNQVACLATTNNALAGPVNNAVNFPSKRVSGLDNSQMPRLENKRDEKEENPFVSPCVSEHTGKEAVKNLETDVTSSRNNDTVIPLPGSIPQTQGHCHVNHEVPSLHIECEVDGSSKGTTKDDCNVCEEDPSISVPSANKKRKSKRKRKVTAQDDTSKENIASVNNPLSSPSKRVSSFNNFQVPQLENKHDEKEETPFLSPCVSEHAEKEVVKNVETGVKSSGNNSPSIPLPGSLPKTQDHCLVNHELPSSHIECQVDGSSRGSKFDFIVCEEGASKSVPSVKKKRKSKRKKEDMGQVDTSKENDASVVGPGNDTVQQDIVVLASPSENADKELIKETEVLEEHQHTECNNNNTKNDIGAESMKEASERGPAARKKHRKRKRTLTHDSKEMLKLETASQKEEAQKSGEAHKESKESKDQYEFNSDRSQDDVEFKHDKVTEDASDTRTPAKKKQKGKDKSGDNNLSKEKLPMSSDFNVDNASHHFLEDQQKTKNSSPAADQSAEHFNDTDHLRNNVLGGKRKGKKNSSNPDETPVATSSRKNDEADRSSIRGGVQEEISEDGLFSKGDTTQEIDIGMSKTTLDNMEIGTDASKEGIGSKLHLSDVNEPKELTEDNANIVLDHSYKSEAGQSEEAEEGRQVSPQNDPKPMLSEKCPPSNQDNTDANIREFTVTSKVVDENGITEPLKSEKKKKAIRKAQNSGGGQALRPGIGLVDASDNETIIVKSLEATNCNPMPGNTETEENPLNQTEGKDIWQKETVLSATNNEDGFSADDAGSLEQIQTKANAGHVDEHVDKRQRKKPNNKQISTSKSVSNIAMPSTGENRKPHAKASRKSMDLKKLREHFTISSSKLEGSKKMVQNKAGKASRSNIGGVVSNTQQKKSLLAGAIFKDESSGTSEDEDEVDNSDASTRTPSDNSLLSGFSDGDSNAGLDSQQNGSCGGKKLENGGRNALGASLSGIKGMPIDRVLRSSSRYKKAIVTASQLEETESQLEFVPDSLADK